jgi:hypothetical protein
VLGRKTYTQEELDTARTAVDQQLEAYRTLVERVTAATTDEKVLSVLDDLEAPYFNSLVLVLDRYFVHRLRSVTGKDGNALNEVELLVESLMNNNGIFRGNNVVKLDPGKSVVKVRYGDPIRLSADDFERLSTAFYADIGSKYVA